MAARPAQPAELFRLLDDDPFSNAVEPWRARNLRLHDELCLRGHWDPGTVSGEAHRFLTARLITDDNPAALDPQNAGHVRAQNENILDFGLAMGMSPEALSVCLTAGFIHDLNKAAGERLRRDHFAVRDVRGRIHGRLESMAEVVGLNHLGDRTRQALADARRLPRRARLSEAVAESIDRTIVHHGLGSSVFIRRLIDGDNEWWGADFVDTAHGERRLIHPPPPPLALPSVVHDMADSIQQMQAGLAWLTKYPEGFWSRSGRSLWAMFSGPPDGGARGIPMSLLQQSEVEALTCLGIVAEAHQRALVDATERRALERALADATRLSLEWVDDSPEHLERPQGRSVYHDVGRALGRSPAEVVALMKRTRVGSAAYRRLRPLVQASARRIDVRRVRRLVRRLAG